MDRRQFLKSVVGSGALVGAAVAMPAIAHAVLGKPEATAEVPDAIFIHPYQKHIDALRMMDEAIALYPRGMRGNGSWKCWKESDNPKKMHDKIDELLIHMHANWEIPDDAAKREKITKALKELLEGGRDQNWKAEDYEKQLRSIPPVVVDAVWPVLVMKAMLRDCALPINHRRLTQFNEFHQRYGWLILEEPRTLLSI